MRELCWFDFLKIGVNASQLCMQLEQVQKENLKDPVEQDSNSCLSQYQFSALTKNWTIKPKKWELPFIMAEYPSSFCLGAVSTQTDYKKWCCFKYNNKMQKATRFRGLTVIWEKYGVGLFHKLLICILQQNGYPSFNLCCHNLSLLSHCWVRLSQKYSFQKTSCRSFEVFNIRAININKVSS